MCIGPKTFVWGERTYVMGVINVSPESFSGDGVADADGAIARARQLVDEGADMLDVGGQSTRPGARGTDEGFDETAPEERIGGAVPVTKRRPFELPDFPLSSAT